MTTSRNERKTKEISHKIPLFDLAYERQRLRNKIHDIVLERFLEESAASGVTRADIARRLDKRPEQITRWLSAPGNWTIDTISDLMCAMGLDPSSVLRGDEQRTAPKVTREAQSLRGSAMGILDTPSLGAFAAWRSEAETPPYRLIASSCVRERLAATFSNRAGR